MRKSIGFQTNALAGIAALGLTGLWGCSKSIPPRQKESAPQAELQAVAQPVPPAGVAQPGVAAVLAPAVVTPVVAELADSATVTFAPPDRVIEGKPPANAQSLADAVAALMAASRAPGMPDLAALLTPEAVRRLQALSAGGPLPLTPSVIATRFAGRVERVVYQGGRATVVVRQPDGSPLTSWLFLKDGKWLLDLTDSRPLLPPFAGPANPANTPVQLATVRARAPGQGRLAARMTTSAGVATCTLREDLVPDAVAHFAGLVIGLRAHRVAEDQALTANWATTPFYTGPAGSVYSAGDDFVAAGCPFGTGGGNAGFAVADALDVRLRHDKPGVLSLVADGANTASSRFAVSLQPRPDRDDRDSIIGECDSPEVWRALAKQPQKDRRIQRIELFRSI